MKRMDAHPPRSPKSRFSLSSPKTGLWPASRLELSPGEVDASTGPSTFSPSTDLYVRPFEIDARTAQERVSGGIRARVRLFDIRLGLGPLELRIQPFKIEIGKVKE